MRVKFLFTILFPLMMIPSWEVHSQEATTTPSQQIIVQNPKPGEALQGIFVISANFYIEGLVSAEVSFSYTDDPRETWFLIRETQEPEIDNLIAEWDTTVITDGEYTLRVYATSEQDQYVAYVTGLRVRNYTPIETSIPISSSPPKPAGTLSPTRKPTETPTQIPLTPTPLPPNPAQLTTDDVTKSMGKGAVFAIGALILFGIYHFLKRRR